MKIALAVLLSLLAASCDREDAKRAPPPTPPAAPAAPLPSLARALGMDAGELEAPVDPPAPAGDFKADVDAFTTVDACAQQHAALDPLVGDAIEAIGYDTLVRDACRVLDAAKARDARRCEAIDASSLRARCEAAVAQVAGDPEQCPFWIPTRPELGRDPACLALAARDPRLCAAAIEAPARATCAAIATHDAAACKQLPMRADQQRCARDVQRWSSSVPAAEAPHGADTGSRATATAAGRAVGVDASRGVVLVERIDGTHFVVGPLGSVASSTVPASPGAQGTLAFEVVAPVDPKRTHLDRLELALPQREPLVVEGPRASGVTVKIARLERRRGGAVEVALDGPAADGVPLQASVTTFVRDVVKASAILGVPQARPESARSPEFGLEHPTRADSISDVARGFGDAGGLR